MQGLACRQGAAESRLSREIMLRISGSHTAGAFIETDTIAAAIQKVSTDSIFIPSESADYSPCRRAMTRAPGPLWTPRAEPSWAT